MSLEYFWIFSLEIVIEKDMGFTTGFKWVRFVYRLIIYLNLPSLHWPFMAPFDPPEGQEIRVSMDLGGPPRTPEKGVTGGSHRSHMEARQNRKLAIAAAIRRIGPASGGGGIAA